jgi:hypothetical protein
MNKHAFQNKKIRMMFETHPWHMLPHDDNKQPKEKATVGVFAISTFLSEFGSPFDVLRKVFLAH